MNISVNFHFNVVVAAQADYYRIRRNTFIFKVQLVGRSDINTAAFGSGECPVKFFKNKVNLFFSRDFPGSVAGALPEVKSSCHKRAHDNGEERDINNHFNYGEPGSEFWQCSFRA